MERRKTRQIRVGAVAVGGGAPVSVQSMTKTDTRDVAATAAQVRELAAAGCEIVRLAVVDEEAARALAEIRKASPIPMIADIHFDYRLALISLESGVDGLRINPGNIGAAWKVREVVTAASERGVPIRIGVNSGSVEKDLQRKHGGPTAGAMVESALAHVRILEDLNFRDIKVSLKATDIERTLAANRLFAAQTDIPLHLGVTEAGTIWSGSIKSAAGLGVMLAEGLGDTIRVSLTGNPVEEVRVGWQILKSLDLRQRGVEIISCPTCGRLEMPIEELCHTFEEELRHIDYPFHLAVMGCAVNGPGEGKGADIGVMGTSKGEMVIYKDGQVWRKTSREEVVSIVKAEFERKLEEIKSGRAPEKPHGRPEKETPAMTEKIPTITVRHAAKRGHRNYGWLDTRCTFSCGDYFDSEHIGFRSMRVLNEDRVNPGAEFPSHPHEHMEILTYILSGALEHKDTQGNGTIIPRGDVQHLSAGTGVEHSEFSPSSTEPVHLLQIWILPDRQDYPPTYEQRTFPDEEKRGRLRLIASPDGRDGSLVIHQDVCVYASILEPGEKVEHEVAAGRYAWVQVAGGSVKLCDETLAAGDGASVTGDGRLVIEGIETAEFLLFDLN